MFTAFQLILVSQSAEREGFVTSSHPYIDKRFAVASCEGPYLQKAVKSNIKILRSKNRNFRSNLHTFF